MPKKTHSCLQPPFDECIHDRSTIFMQKMNIICVRILQFRIIIRSFFICSALTTNAYLCRHPISSEDNARWCSHDSTTTSPATRLEFSFERVFLTFSYIFIQRFFDPINYAAIEYIIIAISRLSAKLVTISLSFSRRRCET